MLEGWPPDYGLWEEVEPLGGVASQEEMRSLGMCLVVGSEGWGSISLNKDITPQIPRGEQPPLPHALTMVPEPPRSQAALDPKL